MTERASPCGKEAVVDEGIGLITVQLLGDAVEGVVDAVHIAPKDLPAHPAPAISPPPKSESDAAGARSVATLLAAKV